MTLAPLRRRRGFTLIEMMVGSTVMLLAIGLSMSAFLAYNASLKSQELSRVASESGRDTMLELETNLRAAGWGIDPRYTIDMVYRCPAAPTVCRDSTVSPDELAFVSRNPRYRWFAKGTGTCTLAGGCFEGRAWTIESADLASSPRTVKVTLRPNQVLERGRVVLATCSGGSSAVMLTLANRYEGGAAGATVTLVPESTNAVPYNEFGTTATTGLRTCHNEAGASLFLVDRYRYFVATYGGQPWLMLDPGVDTDGDGTLPPADTDDLVPVAKGVEDLQVSYVLLRHPTLAAPDSNGDWVVGNDRSATSTPKPAEALNPNLAAPVYATPDADPLRASLHPANVRAVRLTLTLRSAVPAPDDAASPVAGGENRTGNLGGDRYRRYVMRSEIALRNQLSKNPFIY